LGISIEGYWVINLNQHRELKRFIWKTMHTVLRLQEGIYPHGPQVHEWSQKWSWVFRCISASKITSHGNWYNIGFLRSQLLIGTLGYPNWISEDVSEHVVRFPSFTLVYSLPSLCSWQWGSQIGNKNGSPQSSWPVSSWIPLAENETGPTGKLEHWLVSS
jgi:hypothetical protein